MWLIFGIILLHFSSAQNQYNPPTSNGFGGSASVWNEKTILKEATYFVVASQMVRPGQVYRIAATVYSMQHPITLRASIQRNGVEIAADSHNVKRAIPEVLLMKIPPTSSAGHYKLKVEGLYDGIIGGTAFVNETNLVFSQRSMTIFIQTDKPIYKQSETVKIRAIPITTELRAFDGIVDVYMLDPKKRILKRWLSRQSNLGTVSLEYELSDQPVFGEWTIKVIAQGQIEESNFVVEEYYQTRFEVNVTMPPYIFSSDEYLIGTVMANYTGGAPVVGNLTLKATIRPYKTSNLYIKDFTPIAEHLFDFEESYPFWYPQQKKDNLKRIPHLTWFRGTYTFKYPVRDLLANIPNFDEYEVQITATVGERFLDEIIEGYSIARFFNSSAKVFFLGESPQVFKPTAAFTVYLGVSFHDGSPLSRYRLKEGRMELATEVLSKTGGRNTIDIPLGKSDNGIWPLNIDLRTQLGLENNHQVNDILKNVEVVRISATFRDLSGERSFSELLLYSYVSPSEHFIKVSTSTTDARVGEYIMFHVHTNFPMEEFNYVLVSKGIILMASQESTTSSVYTFAVTLSAEMAPSATIVVYHIGKFGDVIADSLTFPVNGISRNNFTVFINNRKARTGEVVEVAIYGEPGAYVGLSGIDRPFYALQLGNELTYAKVLKKMDVYDNEGNSSLLHTWLSHTGDPDDIVHLQSSSYGINANQSFSFAGLIVFTDIVVPGLLNPRNFSNNYYHEKEYGLNITELYQFRKTRFNRIQRHYENTWLWKDINIGPHGRYIFEIPVPRRPAHWMITAFSMSQSFGFGMLQKPVEYMGVLPFFINVEMPSTSRQGEQVGVRVTVFNYMKTAIEAVVLLEGSEWYKFVHVEAEGIVNSYNPRTTFGEHQFFVYIKPQDAVIVYLPIVPIRLGDIEVTVRASTLIASDRVTRVLHVESDGVPQYRHQSVLLDLTNRAYVFQYMHVNVTETPIIPYDIDRYYIYGSNKASISVVGDVVGPIFPTMPLNATSLLNMPMDGAEQTVFGFAAMMYTTMYMRLINVRNRTQEKYSFHYMNIQYQRAMSFMNDDGSFSLFRSDWNIAPKSVWLTAYVIRVFQEARFYEWENYLYIDPEIIYKSLTWLLQHQTDEGAFYEITWLPDRKANISVSVPHDDKPRNISLTAQVLITLSTVKDVGALGGLLKNAQRKAGDWLKKNLNLLQNGVAGDPYEIAVVTYALLLAKHEASQTAITILEQRMRETGGLRYWAKEEVSLPPTKLENQKPYLLPRLPYKYDSRNIEATAYGLMVFVMQHKDNFLESIVKWLNAQRLQDAGWASTQDTAVAMKALMEYTNRERIRDISGLTISIEATALPGQRRIIYVNNRNIAQLQKIDIPHAWGTVKVEARGAGYAILQMSVQYNVDIAKFQTEPPVRAFSLVTRAHFHGRNQSHILYHSCQRWTYHSESIRSGMAVLDVTIPTGYIIQQQILDAYVRSNSVPNLKRARFLEQRVLFFFDYLDDADSCIKFTVERWLPVANMSRYLPIRVYDYYAPERFNETIFDATPTYLLSICEVCGSSQCPYCPIYNAAAVFKATIILSVTFILLLRYLR